MNELHEIAKAHYLAESQEVQDRAYEFFQSMDTNRDGSVNFYEFLTFMREEGGYRHMPNPHLFLELDLDANGTLDFFEVMTLYCIIKSERPFCGSCRKFIPGIYFSCVECFDIGTNSFDLCRGCYQSSNYSHNHNGCVQFLDNYTLLRIRRDPAPAQSPTVNSNSEYSTDDENNNNSDASAENARWSKSKVALEAFEVALTIGSVVGPAAAAAAAAGCTIM